MVIFTTALRRRRSLFDVYLTWKTSFRVCFCSGLVFVVSSNTLPFAPASSPSRAPLSNTLTAVLALTPRQWYIDSQSHCFIGGWVERGPPLYRLRRFTVFFFFTNHLRIKNDGLYNDPCLNRALPPSLSPRVKMFTSVFRRKTALQL